MSIINRYKYLIIAGIAFVFQACSLPALMVKNAGNAIPASYASPAADSANTAKTPWKEFFTDPYLIALIDTALQNNQELNIILQEINIAQNEIRARKGEYLPFVDIGGGIGMDKVGRYTRPGALEANNEIKPGTEFPEPLGDFRLLANASWEVDIWKKLRNAKKSAVYRYLATVEGKNFMVTHLVAEIATAYYELMALDNQLDNLNRNIAIQQNALSIVKLEKIAGAVTELAVRKFEAEVLKNQSHLYYIRQLIVETENRLNFLIGRYPQPIARNSQQFNALAPDTLMVGIPSQLLQNRPDIKQTELELAASKLDVQVAKAQFYPSFRITAGVGYEAFNPRYLMNTPTSAMFNLAGDLVAPLVNRNAIKATYLSANAKQIQAAFQYEQTILNAYIEVANQLAKMNNLATSYDLKNKQVEALTSSVNISTTLFKSARADYMEVLMTQRDALEARMELIETKLQQMTAKVNLYQSLGGGWR